MWGQLLALALMTTINPVRLGLILLVLSRPRPMQNLLAYWTGALIVGHASLLIPLFVIHSNPSSASFADDFADPASNPTAQRIAIGMGVLLVLIAAVMAVRSLVATPVGSRRRPVPERNGEADTSVLALDSTVPPILSRLLQPSQNTGVEGGSPVRRVLSRTHNAWQNGSPWIAFVLGVIILPPLDGVLIALAIIVASGSAVGTQVVAVILYMIGVLAVEEMILASNLIAPARTQAALRRVHDWARTHHRKFVAIILAVIGLSLVIRGMGGI
jgi:hypothetical protein